MRPLTVTVRSPNRQAFTLVIDRRLELGREADGIILIDSRVSRRHIAIEPGTEDAVVVTDLGSSNGTTVDGVEVVGPTRAAVGSVVQVGDTSIEVGSVRGPDRIVNFTAMAGGRTVTARSSMEVVADAVVNELEANVIEVDDEPGTLTIVFSDIESSTELAVKLGDEVWFEVLQRHGRLFEAHVGAHGGRIVKHQGDGYMLCFRSARSALLSAIGVQRDLSGTAWSPPGQELRVRVGVHLGEVVVDDEGDLFGKHVVVASRIGALAEGAEILVSSLVRQIAEPRGDIRFHSPREVELRGIGGAETVWSVDWRGYGLPAGADC
jgi:class 3 adenylate cyclase